MDETVKLVVQIFCERDAPSSHMNDSEHHLLIYSHTFLFRAAARCTMSVKDHTHCLIQKVDMVFNERPGLRSLEWTQFSEMHFMYCT